MKLLSPQFTPYLARPPQEEHSSTERDTSMIEHKTTRSFDDGEGIIPLSRAETIEVEVP